MTDSPQTPPPESGYGEQLRAAADKIDALIRRERMCDAHCGGRDGMINELKALLLEARHTRASDIVPNDWASRVDEALQP